MGAPPIPSGRSRGGFGKRRSAVLLSLSLLAAACSGGSSPGPSSTTAGPSTPSSATPSLSPTGAQALVASLPSGCEAGGPAAEATITFVAQGRAWAVAPDGAGLTCLFEVSDPGLFEWGPRADRVLLGGLEVRGVGSGVARPPGSVDPADASWGRPTGSAVVFVDSTGKKLQKAALGGTTIEDVTPPDTDANGDPIEGFPAHADVTFQQVAYHPSGRALGFVLTDTEGSAVWMSTNTGSAPKRLIWSHSGTIFGPIAFRPDGTTLYYAAHLKNGTRLISAATLGKEGRVTTGLWTGTQNVLRMVPAPGGKAMALDTGTGCDDRNAFVSVLDTTGGRALLPDAAGPTSVIGWVDDSTVLVAEGGCNGPTKLWLTPTGAGATVTLVMDGVDRARFGSPIPLHLRPCLNSEPTKDLPDDVSGGRSAPRATGSLKHTCTLAGR